MRSFRRFTWPPGPGRTVLFHETGRSDGCSYVYNASGQRIEKTTSWGTFYYLYDLAGHVISKLTSTGGWNRGEIFAGGRHLATYVNNTTYFAHGDWLGTERARTDVNGAISETCQGLPFGDGLSCSGSDVSPLHFTGKQHDSETGLDYFGARYDSSSVGRFMTPDWSAKVEPVPYAKLGDPQSLNLYTYVMNNPVTDLDADGHQCGATGPNGCTPPPAKHPKMANRQAKQQKNTLHYKKGVPPASPKLAKTLRCTQRCTGLTLTVTSTTDEVIRKGRVVAHGPSTPHGKGEAADLREPKGTGGPILFCGAVCGAKFGLDEGRHPSKHASGPHVHLQITPGRHGGRGDLPLVDIFPDLGTTSLSPLE